MWPQPATTLSRALESEAPDLVLLGQQSMTVSAHTIGAAVADHLMIGR